jgi:O-antigen ligase
MDAARQSAAVFLALFVFAGYFKAADFLRVVPVDLTLVFGAITTCFCIWFLGRERRLPPGWWAVLALFLAMAVGLHWPGDLSSYPVQKELRLYSLTALSAAAPLLLLRRERERRHFVYLVAVLGAVMGILALAVLVVSGLQPRLSAFNTNPILLARASGFTVLVLCLLYWLGRIRLQIFAPASASLLCVVLLSGTRGPLIALLATVCLTLPFAVALKDARRRVWATVLFGVAGLGAAVVYLATAWQSIGERFLRLATGEWGDTETSRSAIWRETAALIAESPLGVGWGRISEHIQVFNDGELLLHPHNIFLEIAAEAGWIALVIFVVLVGVIGVAGIRSGIRVTETSSISSALDRLIVFSAPAYWLGCAMFSGDVNDNRPLWAMLAMALAAQLNSDLDKGVDAQKSDERPAC